MAARVVLREIGKEEGNRLLRIVRRRTGSVVTCRRARIVLLAAQGMSPARISEVVFTDPDTAREVIHNFNRDGFDALYPRYAGGRRDIVALIPSTSEGPRRRLSPAAPIPRVTASCICCGAILGSTRSATRGLSTAEWRRWAQPHPWNQS